MYSSKNLDGITLIHILCLEGVNEKIDTYKQMKRFVDLRIQKC